MSLIRYFVSDTTIANTVFHYIVTVTQRIGQHSHYKVCM